MALDSAEKQDKIPKIDASSSSLNEEEEYDSSILSAFVLRSSQIFSAALNAAVELNLFDIIAKEEGKLMSASEVASQLPSSSQHKDLAFRIDRLLRLLATHSLLTCSSQHDERLYGISPIGKHFVSESLGFVPTYCRPPLVNAWHNFKDAIIDEEIELFKKIGGKPIYQYAQTDPTWNKNFNKSMASVTNIQMRRILEIYKGFEGISTLVDVGGGIGQNLTMILSKYPSIKGINFDLPHVTQNAPPHPGIEHVGGDMFESVPKGDAIILKAVCHNWSDEKSIKVLSKCHEALPENGKVIVVEFIMPEVVGPTNEAKFVSIMDNMMFFLDGKERTEKEFESLCKRSGFSDFKVACLVFFALGVMEFYK